MGERSEHVERHAARAIVLDPDGCVLLQDLLADSGRCWILPGGGLAGGETHEAALRRELAEEVGLRDAAIGPCVWLRTAQFAFRGREYTQHERFYVVRSDRFEFDDGGLDAEEVGVVLGHRWWSVDEMEAQPRITFWPRGLAARLRSLLEEIPAAPVELDG